MMPILWKFFGLIPWRWLMVAKRFVNRLGLDVQRTRVAGDNYAMCTPYTRSTHVPESDVWFGGVWQYVKNRTFLTPDRVYILYRLAQVALNVQGNFAECGVYRGGSAYVLASLLASDVVAGYKAKSKVLHLFDTFCGMPSIADADDSFHHAGDFSDTSFHAVQKYLGSFPVRFHPGVVPETLGEVGDESFAFVHLDLDLHESTRDALKFFYSRMSPGGIMVFDEYGDPAYQFSEKVAVDHFFRDKPECPIVLRTGQAFIIKAGK